MNQAAEKPNSLSKGFLLLQEFSAFLLVGTVLALLWSNLAPHSYEELVHHKNITILGHHYNAFHFFVNDIFMVLFFGIAMKEVSESVLPGGPLSSVKKASMPVFAMLGGVLGPIACFFIFNALMGPADADISSAWAVPTATDIAYSWLFAGLIFGRAHPAVTFLVVLAVLDDLVGMMIIAVFYTNGAQPIWLLLVLTGVVVCEGLRRAKVKSFWPYFLIGAPLCWFGLYLTGVHAALALVPVIPFMPHAVRDAGIFAQESGEIDHNDTMGAFEHFFKPIVDIGLFFFGLANAGVILDIATFQGSPTWIILFALLIGKTAGILGFVLVGQALGLTLPKPMTNKHVIVLGCVAGIGFTVALFVTGVAVDLNDALRDSGYAGGLKLGALLSFAAGPLAFMLAKAFQIKKINHASELPGD